MLKAVEYRAGYEQMEQKCVVTNQIVEAVVSDLGGNRV